MKIKYSELKKMVVEEMKKLGMLKLSESDKSSLKSVEDAADDATEIEPGDEGRLPNQKQIDALKARKIQELKIKESKLYKALMSTRQEIKSQGNK